MNERDVLEQRVVTLASLLEAPGGPLGPAGGALSDSLQSTWRAELRLLRRLLDESAGGDIQDTVRTWHDRTAAFLARSEDDAPAWTDRDGHEWRADQVLQLLDEAQERLDSWSRAAGPDEDESGSAPPTSTGAGPVAQP